MTTVQNSTKCGGCKLELKERGENDRKPCPRCSSLTRDFSISIQENISVHERLGLKKFISGNKKAQQETVVGDDFHRDSGEWRKLERNIDRENNKYTEVIKDSKGKVIRFVEELLTEHTGHGSAKKKKTV